MRSRAIDCLRGVAILLIIGCHFVASPDSAGLLAPLARIWHRVGWAGVDLFFVLSGYLVSGLLFAEYQRRQRVDFRRFLVRRGLKIWPAYFVYLAFVALWLAWKSRPGGPSVSALWPNLLHVQNYFGTPRVHTWSLALEEHFYLVAALLAAWCLTPARIMWVRALLIPGAGLVLGIVALARHAGFEQGGREALNLFASHLRFDGLLVGTLLAWCTHFEPRRLEFARRHPLATALAGLALAAPMLALTPDQSAWTAGFGLTSMYLGFALLVAGSVFLEADVPKARQAFGSVPLRLLSWIGFFSYGIYLWHVDLAQTPMKKLAEALDQWALPAGVTWGVATTAYVVAAVLMGALMSRLIEWPVLALRDRLYPAPAGSRPAARGPKQPDACLKADKSVADAPVGGPVAAVQ